MNWVEIWVIEISEEPENTRPQNFSEEDDKGSKVKDIHHANKPVNEDTGPWSCLKGLEPVLESGIKQRQTANVQPDPTDDGEGKDLCHQQQSDLDYYIAQPQSSGSFPKPEEAGDGVESDE